MLEHEDDEELSSESHLISENSSKSHVRKFSNLSKLVLDPIVMAKSSQK